ncbi:unnamed protein product [Ilex paraguariensis]|uniref:Spen paralogue and orthologue SPOC C-terminal domain-containing protein n=1 Tax=Ilex paraguariensis TaxID=185542 RepID=A0ABC8R1D4_9AQUA
MPPSFKQSDHSCQKLAMNRIFFLPVEALDPSLHNVIGNFDEVISLCWKEGSSATGLEGMKEVAKGYQKGKRVGFAQLAPGVDLYICPRSEAIITILAKYGFFKGMTAVEDNQDSLIGCVVWRKNRTSSNTGAKTSEIKDNSLPEQPLKSPSDSSTQQVAEKSLSPGPPTQESLPLAPVTYVPSLGSAEGNVAANKNIEASETHIDVRNFSSGVNSSPTSSVPSKSSYVPMERQTSAQSHSPRQATRGHLLEVEATPIHCSGAEQLKPSLELKQTVISLPSDVRKPTMPTDDDDLPEFDFNTACGISLTPRSKPLDAAMLGKQLPDEGIKNINASGPPSMPVVQSIPVSRQRLDSSILSRIPSVTSQGMPPPKGVSERESQIPAFRNLQDNVGVQSKVTPTSVSAAALASSKDSFNELPQKKNLFDDDDDMPEWCPPDPHKISLGEEIKPSAAFSSEISISVFQKHISRPSTTSTLISIHNCNTSTIFLPSIPSCISLSNIDKYEGTTTQTVSKWSESVNEVQF